MGLKGSFKGYNMGLKGSFKGCNMGLQGPSFPYLGPYSRACSSL